MQRTRHRLAATAAATLAGLTLAAALALAGEDDDGDDEDAQVESPTVPVPVPVESAGGGSGEVSGVVIPTIDVDAPVVPVGVDDAGALEVPREFPIPGGGRAAPGRVSAAPP